MIFYTFFHFVKMKSFVARPLKKRLCFGDAFCDCFLVFAGSDAFVQVSDQSVYVDTMGAGTFADRFKVSGHAADAAEAIGLENLDDLRIFLNGFDDTCVFCNDWHFYSSFKLLFRDVLKELPDYSHYNILVVLFQW